VKDETIGSVSERRGVAGNLLLSIYLGLVIVALHDTAGGESWSISLYKFYMRHRHPGLNRLMDDDYHLAAATFFLVWAFAGVFFLGLSLCRPGARASLGRALGGVVGVAGFPLVCIVQGERATFAIGELILALAVIGLFAYGKWPLSTLASIILLILHYLFWVRFAHGYRAVGGWYIFWPGWNWYWSRNSLQFAWLTYPLLGFCTVMLCVGRAGGSKESAEPVRSSRPG